MIEALRNRVEELTEQLIDTALRKREFDLISEYALPLPATIIAELVGVPAEDRDRFHRWSAKVVSLSPSAGPEMLFSIPAALAFLKYIQQQIRIRRNAPGTDLLGALIAAEEGGDKLTEDELVAMIFLLLIAGHETTVNLIGNGTLALLENPEQLSKVLANPDLLRSAIEEMLRYYSPVQLATERWAREDVVMSETAIPKGDLVFLALASANRDSAQFREPHIFDIARNQGRHIAFGFGVHYCLGAPLARLEAEIAFKTLLRHLPEPVMAVSHNSLKWRKGFLLRGLERLPLFGRT
jgi:cytochrome P450 PksS